MTKDEMQELGDLLQKDIDKYINVNGAVKAIQKRLSQSSKFASFSNEETILSYVAGYVYGWYKTKTGQSFEFSEKEFKVLNSRSN